MNEGRKEREEGRRKGKEGLNVEWMNEEMNVEREVGEKQKGEYNAGCKDRTTEEKIFRGWMKRKIVDDAGIKERRGAPHTNIL